MDEVTVEIAAPPERVWALVSDLPRMGRFSPEARGGWWRRPAKGPEIGARFVGRNAHGLVQWFTRATVTECDAPKRFAFTVAESGMTWGFRLEPDGAGTRLTQWRDHTASTNPLVTAVQKSGLLGRERERLMVDGMHLSLGRIKSYLESGIPGRST
jgi:uncharacterized protein YndB with AHSA1/START domain